MQYVLHAYILMSSVHKVSVCLLCVLFTKQDRLWLITCLSSSVTLDLSEDRTVPWSPPILSPCFLSLLECSLVAALLFLVSFKIQLTCHQRWLQQALPILLISRSALIPPHFSLHLRIFAKLFIFLPLSLFPWVARSTRHALLVNSEYLRCLHQVLTQ